MPVVVTPPTEDTITDLEERLNDEVACIVDTCTRPAVVRAVKRCCKRTDTLCRPCYEWARADCERQMRWLSRFFVHPFCMECGHRFPVHSKFDDAFSVVPL